MTKKIIHSLAKQLGILLLQQKVSCAVAESCTGGYLSAAITDIPGSSQWFDRGFVTYSNQSKEELLGVPSELIQRYGVVSDAVVLKMAEGVLANSQAKLSTSISGIAGPDGGSEAKPVGTVWIGFAAVGIAAEAHHYIFPGDRLAIRQQTVQSALKGLINYLKKI